MVRRLESGRRRAEGGFNLIEVLIAMAILGSVLLGVVTLFFLGRSNVYSGKQMTTALSVANRVMEDLAPLNRDQVYAAFGLSADDLATNTVAGVDYDDSCVRDTTMASVSGSAAVAKDADRHLQYWKALLTADKFTQANGLPKITLIFMPRNDTVAPKDEPASPSTTTTPTSQILQIRVVMEWQEGLRQRQILLDTVKTVRRRIPGSGS